MEQSPLYNAINFSHMWGVGTQGNYSGKFYISQVNQTVRETIVNAFICPSENSPPTHLSPHNDVGPADREAGTSYLGNMGDNTLRCSAPAANNGQVFFCTRQGYNASYPQLGDDSSDNPPGGSGVLFRAGPNMGIRDITDGTSNTLMIGEQVRAACNHNGWAHANTSTGVTAIPLNFRQQPATRSWEWTYSFRSKHPGGGNFALADGSVKFLKDSINFAIYQNVSICDLGEIISADAY